MSISHCTEELIDILATGIANAKQITKVWIVINYVGFHIIAVCSTREAAQNILQEYKKTSHKDALIKEMELQ